MTPKIPERSGSTAALLSQRSLHSPTNLGGSAGGFGIGAEAEKDIGAIKTGLKEMQVGSSQQQEVMKGLKELVGALVREMGELKDHTKDVKSFLGNNKTMNERVAHMMEMNAAGGGGGNNAGASCGGGSGGNVLAGITNNFYPGGGRAPSQRKEQLSFGCYVHCHSLGVFFREKWAPQSPQCEA